MSFSDPAAGGSDDWALAEANIKFCYTSNYQFIVVFLNVCTNHCLIQIRSLLFLFYS